MKARDLKVRLMALGWWLKREGGNHKIWTNGCLGIGKSMNAWQEKFLKLLNLENEGVKNEIDGNIL